MSTAQVLKYYPIHPLWKKKISLRDSKVTYSQPKQRQHPELFTNLYPNLGSFSKKKKRRHYLRKKIKGSQENQNGHFFHHWICKQLTS